MLPRKERRKTHFCILRLKKKLKSLYGNETDENLLYFYAAQIIKLSFLDLSPLKEVFSPLYSSKPRGKPHQDPISMFRSLLLMSLLHIHSITKWVSSLKAFPLLATLSGFNPSRVPGVGTFYDFINRIYPEEKSKNVLLLSKPKPKQQLKSNEKLPPKHPGIVKKLAQRAIKYIEQPLPQSPADILNLILAQCFVLPSANMGILGDPKQMLISGDGTTVKTGANPSGIKTCACKSKGIYHCHCSRKFSDPQARWGWDSYDEQYVYGHGLYILTAADSPYDLPIYLHFTQCQRHDSVSSIVSLTNAYKIYKNTFNFSIFSGDTAHDNYPFYNFLNSLNISPVIPLKDSDKPNLKFNIPYTVNADGSLSCSYGKMVYWGFCKDRCRIKYRCPLYNSTYEQKLKLCENAHLCSNTNYGKTTYIHPSWDYRLFTTIPRSSELWKEKMKRRTSSERCNKRIKVDYSLEQAHIRSRKQWFVRTSLIAMCLHLDAWYNQWIDTT